LWFTKSPHTSNILVSKTYRGPATRSTIGFAAGPFDGTSPGICTGAFVTDFPALMLDVKWLMVRPQGQRDSVLHGFTPTTVNTSGAGADPLAIFRSVTAPFPLSIGAPLA